MIHLLTIAFTWCLPLQSVPSSPAIAGIETTSKCCNETFRFCVEFPQTSLPLQFEAREGNGFILRSADQLVEVTAFGVLNREQHSPRQLFEQAQAQFTTLEQKPVVISTLFGEDFYEGFFLLGERSFFHSVFLFEGYFVRMTVEAPVSQPAQMEQLRKEINVQFLLPDEQASPSIAPVTPDSPQLRQADGSGSN